MIDPVRFRYAAESRDELADAAAGAKGVPAEIERPDGKREQAGEAREEQHDADDLV